MTRTSPRSSYTTWRVPRASASLRLSGALMRTRAAEGPFVLGARPSYTDFFVAGAVQSSRVVDEGVLERIVKFPGFSDIYTACLPYMDKQT